LGPDIRVKVTPGAIVPRGILADIVSVCNSHAFLKVRWFCLWVSRFACFPTRPNPKLHQDQAFQRAIEEIKARVSLEEIVGECIEGNFVTRSRRQWCCCPLHDEDSPSFAIGPDPDMWYCFGACRAGGDVIEFVKLRHNTSFMDSLEWLAARAGVEIPRSRGRSDKDDPGLKLLADTEAYYNSCLMGNEGRVARDYLNSRGISEGAIEAFGIGYSPASGQALVQRAQSQGTPFALLEQAGLARSSDQGRNYDFFRGRLMVPIRDHRKRTVGFGARRLDSGESDSAGPKYVNTPETPWFHKGRVIFGYDRASDSLRKGGHLILMEGYTDVIAAHQAGLTHACAVLGTATTPDHARLAQKAGVQRITLIFDGDEAGNRAAWRGLQGLLPLGVDLDVAVPPPGKDPADLVAGGDAGPLMALLEQSDPWLDFTLKSLEGLAGRPLSIAVDRVLELLDYVPKPVHRESCLVALAQGSGLPVEVLRQQRSDLPERRRGAHTAPVSQITPTAPPTGQNPERNRNQPVDPQILKAYRGAVGAALCDTNLIPRVRHLVEVCPHPGHRAILEAMIQLWDSEDPDAPEDITYQHVMNALGEHPVRQHVAAMVQYVYEADEPLALLEAELAFLKQKQDGLQRGRLLARIQELEAHAIGNPEAQAESKRCQIELNQLIQSSLQSSGS
jgi:DNA primase